MLSTSILMDYRQVLIRQVLIRRVMDRSQRSSSSKLLLLIVASTTIIRNTQGFLLPSTTKVWRQQLPSREANGLTTSDQRRLESVLADHAFTSSRLVLRMAKGRKSEKKRRKSSSASSSSSSQQSGQASGPPAPSPSTSSSSSPAADQKSTTESDVFELPSGGPLTSSSVADSGPKGFGAKTSPSSKQVDEAYQRALDKIKGQDTTAIKNRETAIFGGKGGSEEDSTSSGQVMTRSVDIFDLIPQNIQNGFETTLIGALVLNLIVIVVLGIGFTIEALPTSNWDLPENIVTLSKNIGDYLERYNSWFTPSLGVFFAISSLLGSFKIAQLGRGATTYKEGDTMYREKEGRRK